MFSASLVFCLGDLEPVFYVTGFTPQLVPVCSNTVMLQVLQRLKLRVCTWELNQPCKASQFHGCGDLSKLRFSLTFAAQARFFCREATGLGVSLFSVESSWLDGELSTMPHIQRFSIV